MVCFGRLPPSVSKTLLFEGSVEGLILGYGPVSRVSQFLVIVVAGVGMEIVANDRG